MNASATPPDAVHQPTPEPGWSRPRLLRVIFLVFVAHVALIFIFGDRKPIVPRPVKKVPQLHLADGMNGIGHKSDFFALTDPTLFALPHTDAETPPLRITNPAPSWLPLPEEEMAIRLVGSGSTWIPDHAPANPAAALPRDVFKPPPKFNVPDQSFQPVFAQTSSLRPGSGLAERGWMAPPELPSWPDDDVLQATIVQALVDPEGDVVSGVLVRGSGLDAADQRALDIASGLHFAPAPGSTLGELIFNWRTIPLPSTNSAAILQ